MSLLQAGFIIFTFFAPPLLWTISRKLQSDVFNKAVDLGFAIPLLIAFVLDLGFKIYDGGFDPAYTLPMHLCDWTLLLAAFALLRHLQLCFELAYFWGIGGTMQALFTPAETPDRFIQLFGFFLIHSMIPTGIFWLMLSRKMHPQPGSVWRFMIWSEVYLVAALLTNELTGGNYGFLSEKPGTGTLLDVLSDERWLYLFQLNLLALAMFSILYLPWWAIHRAARRRKQ